MSSDELTPAIHHLEQKVTALIGALNVLRAEAGMPPYSPSPDGGGDKPISSSLDIKSDTFFGKRQHTAIREYLEMRKASGDGPARPREIYEALRAGGVKFESDDEQKALVALRAMLRRRTAVFIKVGESGAYGLRSWYPDAKPKKAKAVSEGISEEVSSEQDDAGPEKPAESAEGNETAATEESAAA